MSNIKTIDIINNFYYFFNILTYFGITLVVIDTDGSAFITKAEFDSLKNNFQAQIDNYNSSIDSKIDGAIASYLAGIKVSSTEVRPFFNGLGEKIQVLNSNKVKDITPGKFGINWNVVLAALGDPTGGATWFECALQMLISRSANQNYHEGWILDSDGKFLYYDQWNAIINIALFQCQYDNYAQIPRTVSVLKWRWWADFYGAKTPNDDPNTNPGHSICGNSSRYLKHDTYFECYGSGMNFGVGYQGASFNNKSFSYTISCDNYVSKDNGSQQVKWMFDGSNANSQVWNKLKEGASINSDNLYAGSLNYYNPSQTTYTHPSESLSGIKSEGFGIINGQSSSRTYAANISGIEWTDLGTYDSETGGGAYPFPEPRLILSSYNPKNLINSNFDATTLSSYAGYGFTGSLVQGIPVFISDKQGSVKFDIDTTTLANDSIFAISTTPFDPTTRHIENTPSSSGISNLKIDGVPLTSGAKKIDANHHTVTFDIEKDKPIFFKVGWPSTVTTSLRKTFAMPSNFEFTSAN